MILRRIADGIKNQDWFVVGVEVLIVVVGIFIGLQVDDWNQGRENKTEAKVYLERIQQDLDRDIYFFTFLTNRAEEKRAALKVLKETLLGDSLPEGDPKTFFRLLGQTTPLGFEFPEVQSVTFYDLQSSGKLGLIEKPELRRQIAFYYQESLHRSERVEARLTGFSPAVFKISAPAIKVGFPKDDLVKGAFEFQGGDINDKEALDGFLRAARNEIFMGLLLAEQNYTDFASFQINIQIKETTALKKQINDYLHSELN